MHARNSDLQELIRYHSLREGTPVQKLILKEVQLIHEEKVYMEFLHEEGLRLKAMGHTSAQVNEQLGDMFSGFLGKGMDAAIDSIKSFIINGLLKFIGLDPKQPGAWGLLGCAISNTLEELDVETFKKLFGGVTQAFSSEDGLKSVWSNTCADLTDLIMRGVTECATEKAQRSKLVLGFYSAIVGDVSSAEAQNNFLWKTSDEMLQNFINDTELMTNIRGQLSDAICAIDVTEMFGSVASGLGGMGSKLLSGLGLDKLIPGASPA